ncbi:MAG: aromatic ring-hydroxylating dioxygenase subunit alpha [Pseudorhodobacter sp.]|nr:aromatic ring-hydroxylating dioxygenase subunit alpha [Pseudorhodobacter sp.]
MSAHAKPGHQPAPVAGLFDPDRAENSWTLPADWYTDPAHYRVEHEKLFYRSWLYQCHVSDLPNPGDYLACKVADQEIFIIRGQDHELQAYFNVCSHRAHPLVSGAGSTKLIVCPYHQWCYQIDGKFRGARGRDSLKDWLPANADLKPVRVEIYGGFVFVNLDPAAEPLIEQAPQLLRDMYQECPQLDSLLRVKRFERQVAANWKTIVDNNHECYHCAVNHKSLMELVDYEGSAHWTEDGITFSHRVLHREGENSSYKLEKLEQESLFAFVFPTLIPLFFPGTPGLVMFQILPTGPETSTVRHDFYFRGEPTEQEQAFMTWITDVLASEDMAICENVQRGLHSRGYVQGKFVVDRARVDFSEHHVHFFQSLVHKAMTQ